MTPSFGGVVYHYRTRTQRHTHMHSHSATHTCSRHCMFGHPQPTTASSSSSIWRTEDSSCHAIRLSVCLPSSACLSLYFSRSLSACPPLLLSISLCLSVCPFISSSANQSASQLNTSAVLPHKLPIVLIARMAQSSAGRQQSRRLDTL